jgi:hypothetical protein
LATAAEPAPKDKTPLIDQNDVVILTREQSVDASFLTRSARLLRQSIRDYRNINLSVKNDVRHQLAA